MSAPSESPRPKGIHGQALGRKLIDAGLISADERVIRVIIDVPCDGPVVMHVQRWGDERLLEIVYDLDGAEIRRQDDAP